MTRSGSSCRAGERIRPAARGAEDREPVQLEGVGDLLDVARPVENGPALLIVREPVPRPVEPDDSNPGLPGGRLCEQRLEPRAGVPVEVEARFAVRPAVLGVAEAPAVAQPERQAGGGP